MIAFSGGLCFQIDVLEYLHCHCYVHADIKAANLLLSLKDKNQIYLVDYGLAYKYRSLLPLSTPYVSLDLRASCLSLPPFLFDCIDAPVYPVISHFS